jgi:hypothetical protein
MRGDVPLAHGELVANALTFVGHSSGSPASDCDKMPVGVSPDDLHGCERLILQQVQEQPCGASRLFPLH